MTEQRLIDANALDDALAQVQTSLESNEDQVWERNRGHHKGLATARAIVREAPAIDAVPVVHGWWMSAAGKSHIWYCSACGDKIKYKQNRRTYNIPKVPVEQKNKFCRNCGARMDGGAEDGADRD